MLLLVPVPPIRPPKASWPWRLESWSGSTVDVGLGVVSACCLWLCHFWAAMICACSWYPCNAFHADGLGRLSFVELQRVAVVALLRISALFAFISDTELFPCGLFLHLVDWAFCWLLRSLRQNASRKRWEMCSTGLAVSFCPSCSYHQTV